jgi:hypothetical protein
MMIFSFVNGAIQPQTAIYMPLMKKISLTT